MPNGAGRLLCRARAVRLAVSGRVLAFLAA
jgi:hypothetical protein